jgi:hypothetical protein
VYGIRPKTVGKPTRAYECRIADMEVLSIKIIGEVVGQEATGGDRRISHRKLVISDQWSGRWRIECFYGRKGRQGRGK